MNEAHRQCGSDEWRAVVRDAILPWALGELDLGDEVLEVGPGYGATTDVLAESVPRLTAVEIDEELAAMLADRFAPHAGVAVLVGDATQLQFPNDSFSSVVSFTMLHHVPTVALQDLVFREAFRVLRPGGVFVAGDSLANPELEAHHDGDTYNPVDPDGVVERLSRSGFGDATVKINDFGWTANATKPLQDAG